MLMLRSWMLKIFCTFTFLGATHCSWIYGQAASLGKEIASAPQLTTEGKISILLRIPASIISKSVDRDFQHTTPIQREILGTRSTGVAKCQGAVTCELVEHSKGAELRCRISGTISSSTCGINGPAVIQAQANSNYVAYKYAIFDGHRFTTTPATVQVTTQLKVNGIASRLPGLRGRLVRRVASRKAIESHDQAEAITAKLTAEELCKKIDIDFDERIQTLNQKLERNLAMLRKLELTGERLVIKSYHDCVEVGILTKDQAGQKTMVPRPPVQDSVELWIKLPPTNALGRLSMAQLLKLTPLWLSSFLDEHPRLSKLDRKVDVELNGDWVVLYLAS